MIKDIFVNLIVAFITFLFSTISHNRLRLKIIRKINSNKLITMRL